MPKAKDFPKKPRPELLPPKARLYEGHENRARWKVGGKPVDLIWMKGRGWVLDSPGHPTSALEVGAALLAGVAPHQMLSSMSALPKAQTAIESLGRFGMLGGAAGVEGALAKVGLDAKLTKEWRYGFADAEGESSGLPDGPPSSGVLPQGVLPTDEKQLLSQILEGAARVEDRSPLGWLFGVEGGLSDLDSMKQQQFNDSLREPMKAGRGKMLQFQRNLVAAGYLTKGELELPGWYGQETQRAYARLLLDAEQHGADAFEIMRERIGIKLKKDVGDLPEAEIGEVEQRRTLADAYIEAWGQRPPPGYLETVKHLNAQELSALERQKDSWLDGDMARGEAEKMEKDLLGALSPAQEQGNEALLKLLEQ